MGGKRRGGGLVGQDRWRWVGGLGGQGLGDLSLAVNWSTVKEMRRTDWDHVCLGVSESVLVCARMW